MTGGIVYLAVAGAVWPVYASVLLRRATAETQYLQIGKAAGLALLWPAMLLITIVGVAVLRTVRSLRRRSMAPPIIAPVPAND